MDKPIQKTPEEIKQAILSQLNAPIVEALHSEGITPSMLAKQLRKEMEAKQRKPFQHQGQVIYSEPLDALDIQQRARMDACKLLDLYPSEKLEVEGTVFQVTMFNKKE